MGKKKNKKNKKKTKYSYYNEEVSTSEDIKLAAQKVFGSSYFTLR